MEENPDPKGTVVAPETSLRLSEAQEGLALDVAIIRHSDLWSLSESQEQMLVRLATLSVERSGASLAGGRELSIVLSSDAEVRTLNASYRGKDKPTNVLSFPYDGEGFAAGEDVLPLGDVVLAFETVEREAGELGIAFSNHVYHLTVHGVLHLLGFDHEGDTDAAEMEGLEREILLSEGYHDPYAEEGADVSRAQGAIATA